MKRTLQLLLVFLFLCSGAMAHGQDFSVLLRVGEPVSSRDLSNRPDVHELLRNVFEGNENSGELDHYQLRSGNIIFQIYAANSSCRAVLVVYDVDRDQIIFSDPDLHIDLTRVKERIRLYQQAGIKPDLVYVLVEITGLGTGLASGDLYIYTVNNGKVKKAYSGLDFESVDACQSKVDADFEYTFQPGAGGDWQVHKSGRRLAFDCPEESEDAFQDCYKKCDPEHYGKKEEEVVDKVWSLADDLKK